MPLIIGGALPTCMPQMIPAVIAIQAIPQRVLHDSLFMGRIIVPKGSSRAIALTPWKGGRVSVSTGLDESLSVRLEARAGIEPAYTDLQSAA